MPAAGKRVIVTGASSGVGRAAAEQLVEGGARVALIARRAEKLEELAGELGDAALGLAADVSDAEAVRATIGEAHRALGGIDAVINAAGIAEGAALDELEPAVWRRTIDINLSGTFYVSREAALLMDDGVIVNIASDLATRGVAGFVHYAAAKSGVVGLTRGLAAELAPRIRVNAVCPGPIDTPMQEAELLLADDPDAARRESQAAVPLGRFASPDEVAAAALFLAFEAPFATGTMMALDGGTTVG